MVHQGQDFETQVMQTARDFLAAHPQEALVMRIDCETDRRVQGPQRVRRRGLRGPGAQPGHRRSAPDWFTEFPKLADIRGKIVVLQNFDATRRGASTTPRTPISTSRTVYDLGDQLRPRLEVVEGQEPARQRAGARSKLYLNYLSAVDQAPVLRGQRQVEPGHQRAAADDRLDPRTEWHVRRQLECIDEFPSVNCLGELCSVAFRGINELATTEINSRRHPNRYGVLYADFPGKSLIKAAIDANFEPQLVLQGLLSRRCIDVPGASQAVGTRVKLWDCHGASNQRFTVDNLRLTIYGNRCLEPADTSGLQGTPVQIGDCDGNRMNQLWRVTPGGAIQHVRSNLCLEPGGAATSNGTPLIIWPCNGTVNQRWLTQRDPLPL